MLMVLTGLFAIRVAAQPAVAAFSVSGAFAFDRWSSGFIAYPLLLVIQLIVLACMILGIESSSRVVAGTKAIRILKGLALAYLATMSIRLVIGLALPGTTGWFAYPLPSAFHLVLASYLWIFAGCIENNSMENPHGNRT